MHGKMPFQKEPCYVIDGGWGVVILTLAQSWPFNCLQRQGGKNTEMTHGASWGYPWDSPSPAWYPLLAELSVCLLEA